MRAGAVMAEPGQVLTSSGLIFASQEQMHHALEEYGTWADNIKVTRLGDRSDGRDAIDSDRLLKWSERRDELDACLEVLQQRYPTAYRLLDVFYRHGCSARPRGWTIAAGAALMRRYQCPDGVRCPLKGYMTEGEDKRMSLETCREAGGRDCVKDRREFYDDVDRAVEKLWLVYRRRHRKGRRDRG